MASIFSRLFGGKPNPEPGWITPSGLAPFLTAEQPPLVIDVRGPGEFTGPLGHIAGAMNIPLDQVAAVWRVRPVNARCFRGLTDDGD